MECRRRPRRAPGAPSGLGTMWWRPLPLPWGRPLVGVHRRRSARDRVNLGFAGAGGAALASRPGAALAPPVSGAARMNDETLAQAEKMLGRTFRDHALLERAITHASIATTRAASNERLEFLGDAVLGLVVCEYLFIQFPDLLEGDMTKIKSVAVSRRTCANITQALGLHDLLIMGKGMQAQSDMPSSLAAAVLESVIGAIYLDAGGGDAGYGAARDFLMPHLEPVIRRAADSGHQQNFKSVLQQVAQERFDMTPAYVMLDEKGPDHAKCFEVCVQIGAQRFPSSWGQSKKQAEQQAALNALQELGCVVQNGDGDVTVVDLSEAGDLNDARTEARAAE